MDKPSWQTPSNNNISGLPADGVRDLPDVSFFSSDGFLTESAYLICVYDNGALGYPQCTYANDAEPYASEVGGTSAATPAMAGVMALINQKAGAAQGLPNAELYKLAAKQSYSSCSAESVTAGSAGCYFNDIDTGTIAMPCDYGASEGGAVYSSSAGAYVPGFTYTGIISSGCSITTGSGDTVGIQNGYSATVGYDQATGLGSLNVANVVNAWPLLPALAGGSSPVTVTVTPASTSTILTNSLAVTGTVASSPAGGTAPIGTVILTAGSYTSPATALLSGAYSITIPANSLVAGTDTINVAYSGSATYDTGSGQVLETVAGSGATFTIDASASPASIAQGASSTVTVTANPVLGYTGSMTLNCSETAFSGGTPTDAPTCSAVGGTASITLGSTGSASFVVETTAPVSAALTYPQIHGKGHGWMGASGGALLALLVFFGIPSRRRGWRQMIGMLVLLVALGALSACGGGSSNNGGGNSDPGTSTGTYTFQVTATPTPAVAPVVTTTFTVTVN